MHILITGGSGLIGTALVASLSSQGHSLSVLTRSAARAPASLKAVAKVIENLDQIDQTPPVNAVINLAGTQIVGKRWSAKRKLEILHSRVGLTRILVQWMSEQSEKPSVLVSASAVGYYGNRGEHEITELSSTGSDFGASLCHEWENAATKAMDFGVRVCIIRTGLVLSTQGGMLKQLLMPFKVYLGSRIGDGQQWMSWIHIADEVAAIEKLVTDARCDGPYNLTAPFPVRNHEFTKTLARTVGRSTFLVTPAWVIKLLLGESAELLLGGQKALPQRVQQAGYAFQLGSLEGALKDLLNKAR